MINVHATDNTENAPILSFNVEIEGTSDVELKSLPINFDVVTQDNIDEFVAAISLWVDGEKIDTVDMTNDCVEEQTASSNCTTVGNDETYFFDDLGLMLDAGQDYEFLIKIDLYGITDTGDLAEGETIAANFGETEMDLASFDAEDETGENLADGDENGTVTGTQSPVRDVGFDVVLVGTPTAVKTTGNASTGTSDSGLFTITFDVTAWDGGIYIDNTAPARVGATESDVNMSASTGTLTTDIRTDSGATEGDDSFTVAQSTTERFSIVGDVRDGATDDLADGFLSMALGNIRYALSDVTGTLTFSYNLGDFVTPALYLDDQGQ